MHLRPGTALRTFLNAQVFTSYGAHYRYERESTHGGDRQVKAVAAEAARDARRQHWRALRIMNDWHWRQRPSPQAHTVAKRPRPHPETAGSRTSALPHFRLRCRIRSKRASNRQPIADKDPERRERHPSFIRIESVEHAMS